jgi:hypothetical protein
MMADPPQIDGKGFQFRDVAKAPSSSPSLMRLMYIGTFVLTGQASTRRDSIQLMLSCPEGDSTERTGLLTNSAGNTAI